MWLETDSLSMVEASFFSSGASASEKQLVMFWE
jgi:hypothetical protein